MSWKDSDVIITLAPMLIALFAGSTVKVSNASVNRGRAIPVCINLDASFDMAISSLSHSVSLDLSAEKRL
jgi:hypothetical protein